MSAVLVKPDPATVLLAAGDDSQVTMTVANVIKSLCSDAWLAFVVAASHTGTYTFWGSVDGVTYTQLTLPTALIVHSTATGGTAALSGNTIVTTTFYGSFLLCLVGLPNYVQIRGTRSAGGAATNLTISAHASGASRGF